MNLPPEFLQSMKLRLGDEFIQFIESYNKPVPVSVRLNPFKPTAKFESAEKIPWARDAYYLPERISFTLDPLFHAGCYYVQEASSMYCESALRSFISGDQPLKVLDLCAAPGGKSTHLLSYLPSGSLVVSNEVISSRNKILQQNIRKWGSANSIVTQNEATDFKRLPGYFDIVIVDAPCSGEGLFRKDPAAADHWSVAAVEMCASRQSDILDAVSLCLKKNGLLVYSTCTFEEDENDKQISMLLETNEFVKLPLPEYEGLARTLHGIQFYPHKIKGEGFYFSLLRKTSSVSGNINYGKPSFSNKYEQVKTKWLDKPEDFLIFTKEAELYAIPEILKQEFTLISKNLYVRQAGIHLGELAHDELVPSHHLALFPGINSSNIKTEFSLETALNYLRGQAINVPGIERGWYLATYEGNALGWIKSVGNRINNYYPKELRIINL